MSGPLGRYSSSDGSVLADGVIKHNRKCRDIAFLVLFAVFWIAMIVNSSFGFDRGNPLRLTYGLDYKGNTCGDRHAHPNLRELELRYWMNPNQIYQSSLKDSQFKLDNARTICLLDCPIPADADGALNWVCDYPEGDIKMSVDDWIDRNYDYYQFLPPGMRNTSIQLQGPCYPVIFPTVNVLWSCQIIAKASNLSMQHWKQMGGADVYQDIIIDEVIHKAINSRSAVLKRYAADVGKAWPVLLVCGAILPVFLSLIWLLLIRHFVSGMPWITVVLFDILIVCLTLFYYRKAGWIGNDAVSPIIGDHDPYYHVQGRELHHLRAVAVLMTVASAVSVLWSVAVARRILKATSVLKVASKVIGDVRALVFFPFVPYAALAVFYIAWLAAAFYLLSSGEVAPNDECGPGCCAYGLGSGRVDCERCCGFGVRRSRHTGASVLFHLVGGYWGTQFVLSCLSTTIAGSVASYYWTRATVAGPLPVLASMRRMMRYGLGSMALGSLVVSAVESSRFVLEPARRRLKAGGDWADGRVWGRFFGPSGWLARGVGWVLRSSNRSAYTMIAISGKGFTSASATATDLIVNNAMQVGKVNVVGDAVLHLGRLCISLTGAVFGFLMLDRHPYRYSHEKISSPLFPVLVCWFLGYIVSTLFFRVVEMSIDTIILSYCQDSEEHQGIARFAPSQLAETFE